MQEDEKKLRFGGIRIPGWIWMLVGVALVLLVLLVTLRVRSFTVSGNQHYTAEEIADATGITEGDILLGVNRTRAASRLMAKLPYIESLTIRRVLPDTIAITVEECPAAAQITSEYDTKWVLGSTGKLLEEVESFDDQSIPIVEGVVVTMPTSGAAASFDDASKGAKLLELLPLLEELSLTDSVTGISLEDLTDITVTWQGRITVRLGTGSDLQYQMQYLAGLASQLPSGKGELDLSFSEENEAVYHPVT